MQKPERRTLGIGQSGAVRFYRIEQVEGTDDIGFDESRGPVDRSVDVTFRGEIHHCAGTMLLQERVDQLAIADIAVSKDMSRIIPQRREITEIARVRQRIEIDDGLIALREPIEHEVGADESGP